MNTQPLEKLLTTMAILIEQAVNSATDDNELADQAKDLFDEIKPALAALQPDPSAPVSILAKKPAQKKESGRVGKNLSELEFRERLLKLWLKSEDFDGDPKDYTPNNVLETMNCCPKHLSDTIAKDLSKIEFTPENWEIKGFQNLPNDLLVLCVEAGGDWECPLLFIIYFDGNTLRGYIPSEGNPYNHTTKMAYGNDEEADEKDGYKYDDYDAHRVDYPKALEDCAKRIKVQP